MAKKSDIEKRRRAESAANRIYADATDAARRRGHENATRNAGLGGLVGGVIGSFAGPPGAAIGAAIGAGFGAAVGADQDREA